MIYGACHWQKNTIALNQLDNFYKQDCLTKIFPTLAKGSWSNHQVFLAQMHAGLLPPNKSNDEPEVDPETGCTICFWGRLDNSEELTHSLGIKGKDVSDAGLILQAWKKWQSHLTQHLHGDFVFCVYDPSLSCLFLARDAMGAKPLYYQIQEQQIIFASSILVFQKIDCSDLSIRQQWIAEYLLQISQDFTATPYKNIFKLAPGHSLYIGPNGHKIERYYQMSPETTLHLKSSGEYIEAYKAQLHEAVRCRLVQRDNLRPIASELSGGMDSSTVTVLAANMMPDPLKQLHAFSHSKHENETAHIECIRQAIPLAGTHILWLTPPDDLYALNILGYPAEHPSSPNLSVFYRLAQQMDIRLLLSGFGGDEFVTSYSSLAFTELYNKGNYQQFLHSQQGNALLRLVRFFKFICKQGWSRNRSSVPLFWEDRNFRWKNHLLQESLLDKFNLKEKLFKGVGYDADYSSLNEFMCDYCWRPYVPTRLESGSLLALSHRVEYRWPLLDKRLIDLFLSIPTSEKYFRGTTRILHRRAIDGQVPNKITWKHGKSMGRHAINHPMRPFTSKHLKQEIPARLHPRLEALVDSGRLAIIINNYDSSSAYSQARTYQLIKKLIILDVWLRQVD